MLFLVNDTFYFFFYSAVFTHSFINQTVMSVYFHFSQTLLFVSVILNISRCSLSNSSTSLFSFPAKFPTFHVDMFQKSWSFLITPISFPFPQFFFGLLYPQPPFPCLVFETRRNFKARFRFVPFPFYPIHDIFRYSTFT